MSRDEAPACGHKDCFTCPYPDCSPKYYKTQAKREKYLNPSVSREAKELMGLSNHQHLRVVDYDQMMRLYEAGQTDSQIAKAMGLTEQSLVNKWRRRYKLPSHEKLKGPIKFDRDEAMQMYQDGLSDVIIAGRLNVTRSAILYWRKKHNLPPNDNGLSNKKEKKAMASKDGATPIPATEPLKPPPGRTTEPLTIQPEILNYVPPKLVKTVPQPISQSDRSIYLEEIEILKAEKTELLIKNAELAGFIEGLKWARIRDGP